jgi:hypothetical protein
LHNKNQKDANQRIHWIEKKISFKISRKFSLANLSLHNFFPNASSTIDIAKIVKEKEQT